jgi:hypothetical protein
MGPLDFVTSKISTIKRHGERYQFCNCSESYVYFTLLFTPYSVVHSVSEGLPTRLNLRMYSRTYRLSRLSQAFITALCEPNVDALGTIIPKFGDGAHGGEFIGEIKPYFHNKNITVQKKTIQNTRCHSCELSTRSSTSQMILDWH